VTAGAAPSSATHPELPPQLARAHLIGIGGAGMSGVARIVLARGGAVSGSDAKDSAAIPVLRELGAKVTVGHAVANLDHCDHQHQGRAPDRSR
jgi:UDP-N-acetylmuramate--alanine ligase